MRTRTDVAIVGAGPVGLLLAAELGLAGLRPVLLERRTERDERPKANGLGGQIVRTLDHRGLLERFAAVASFAGRVPGFPFGPVPLRFGPGDGPLEVIAVPQPRMEQVIEERAGELGVAVRRGHEVTGLAQDVAGVDLEVRGPDGDVAVRARYVVGCDGAHSPVRGWAGIDFPGTTDDEVLRLGHFRASGPTGIFAAPEVDVPGHGRLRPGWNHTPRGRVLVTSLRPGVHVVGVREAGRLPAGPIQLPEMRAALLRVLGAEMALGEPIWLSRTVSEARTADRFRAGRVLLAGDAAHLFPAGGASLNAGLTDAVNLGWKLAAELTGRAPEGLLDTYDAERREAARRALRHTTVQAYLDGADDDTGKALVALLTELVEQPGAAHHLGEVLAGTDVRHPMPGADPHPLLGGLVPDLDLDLETAAGRRRTADLLRTGRPVLLDLGAGAAARAAAAGWADRVDLVTARCANAPADALLVRPDGYVAWAGAPAPDAALRAWFGAPGSTESTAYAASRGEG